MGICASCLGVSRPESHDSESAQLLDDEAYQSGYNYGTSNTQPQGPDPEDLKRERDALDTICQRASDSVIDIWAHHSQTLAPPPRSTATSATASSSRVPSNERSSTPMSASPSKAQDTMSPIQPVRERINRSISPIPGEIGGLKYVAWRDAGSIQITDISTMPKHWGEVVVTKKRGKKKRPGIIGSNGTSNPEDDVFGALVVK
ncbi:hypothetical protein LOZ61_005615 [Ophidiomyces ophidiicola]|nr:hypothetical protein LOZ61_005615 [Ophidiomyces ophidiicola]KAI1931054.1 hypothetical protein LOZ60_000488 [Ophidiomyces ophidiicola]KAI1968284.1 hypothetical protein LOZ56_005100 [Ophidiomyces ophidiicola]KAI2148908.1 hypothetical protein LOZ27_001435 [Ophidiomyces ophidiicola]KAI2240117.1 hypothetical protein LOZ13_003175 [Ophidiomyces ophidiicola]